MSEIDRARPHAVRAQSGHHSHVWAPDEVNSYQSGVLCGQRSPYSGWSWRDRVIDLPEDYLCPRCADRMLGDLRRAIVTTGEWRCKCGGTLQEHRRYGHEFERPISPETGEVETALPESVALADMTLQHACVACVACYRRANLDRLRKAVERERARASEKAKKCRAISRKEA